MHFSVQYVFLYTKVLWNLPKHLHNISQHITWFVIFCVNTRDTWDSHLCLSFATGPSAESSRPAHGHHHADSGCVGWRWLGSNVPALQSGGQHPRLQTSHLPRQYPGAHPSREYWRRLLMHVHDISAPEKHLCFTTGQQCFFLSCERLLELVASVKT